MLLNSEGGVRCSSGTLSLALDNLGDWRVVVGVAFGKRHHLVGLRILSHSVGDGVV